MTSELKIDTGYLIFTKISFIYLYKVMLQSLQVMLQLLQVSMLDYIVCFRTIPDPGSQKLNWHKPPLTVLVIKKMHDENALSAFTQLVKWLIQVKRNKGVRKTFWLSGFYYTCTQFTDINGLGFCHIKTLIIPLQMKCWDGSISESHSVSTSVCLSVDKFCLHMNLETSVLLMDKFAKLLHALINIFVNYHYEKMKLP